MAVVRGAGGPVIALLRRPLAWARQLYEWIERIAAHALALPILGVVSFIEAIFFPIPPDVMLIPMAVARPRRAIVYGVVCTLASVAGAAIGYWVGASAMATWGEGIVQFYGLEANVARMFALYREHGAWVVVIAGFTPLPYKLFALTAGAAAVELPLFLVASVVGRGARFMLITGLIALAGERAAAWIDRHFNTLTIVLVLLLLAAGLWSTL